MYVKVRKIKRIICNKYSCIDYSEFESDKNIVCAEVKKGNLPESSEREQKFIFN